MSRLALHLFGVIHLDRPSKVRAELDDYAGDLDAIFLERPADGMDLRTHVRGLVFAPGITLAYLFYGLIFMPLYALVVREPVPTEWVSVAAVTEDRDLPVHYVDDHPATLVAEGDGAWRYRLLGWIAVLVPAWFAPLTTATTAAVLVGLWLANSVAYRIDRRIWLVAAIPVSLGGLVGATVLDLVWWPAVLSFVLSFLGTVMGTLTYRNRVMLDRARTIAAEEGYERACLVTGKAHLRGMIDLADDVGIEIERVHTSKLFRTGVTSEDPATTGERVPDLGTETEVLGKRVAAALIDGVVVILIGFLIFVSTGLAFELASREFDALGLGITFGGAVLVGPVAYYAALEGIAGNTVGKKLLGLTVVETDGSRIGVRTAIVRNLLRPLDLLTGYFAGFVTILVTERNRKPSDLLAGTVVVATRAPGGAVDESDADRKTGAESTAETATAKNREALESG